MLQKAPHSWGFLFVGGWVDLDMRRCMFLILFICSGFGQTFTSINGEINKIISTDLMDI